MPTLSLIILVCACPLDLASLLTISHAKHEERATPGDGLGLGVLKLNRVTFKNFVLDLRWNPYVDHVFVHFCLSWWQPCKDIVDTYMSVADILQENFNTDLMRSKMRFAYVDCATDKELCNKMGQDTFPVVVHYARKHESPHQSSRSALSSWYGSGKKGHKSLGIWVADTLEEYEKTAASVQQQSILLENPAVLQLTRASDALVKFTKAFLTAAINETDTLMYVDTEGDNITLARRCADITFFMNGKEYKHDGVRFVRKSGLLQISKRNSKKSVVSDVPEEHYDAAQLLLDTALAYRWLDIFMEWIDNYMVTIEVTIVLFFCAIALLQRARRVSSRTQPIAHREKGDSAIQCDDHTLTEHLHE